MGISEKQAGKGRALKVCFGPDTTDFATERSSDLAITYLLSGRNEAGRFPATRYKREFGSLKFLDHKVQKPLITDKGPDTLSPDHFCHFLL